MRRINVDEITLAIREMVIEANTRLPEDIKSALADAMEKETFPRARKILGICLENANLAVSEGMALCQDTGLAVIDLEIGQELQLYGGDLETAVNKGVSEGYLAGSLRKSMVRDPLNRINTGDNSPAVIHIHIVSGENLKITVLPKGAGSENMGQMAMLKPAQGVDGVKDFVLKVVQEAAGNPCPPVIVGVGIGGNMEKVTMLAKQALMREVGQKNPDIQLAGLEAELLGKINQMKIGPQGLGGDTTALAVHIETYPTHIACLPVAVCLGCHSTRRVSRIL
ncbi:MAG: fumarate hydratase [Syntrophomonadaceae bacterium]|nr:fumarate hydratase [Syntrophomonadaceae bacterium]